jgi:outer membrane murein-binding lipoprotein Lpp
MSGIRTSHRLAVFGAGLAVSATLLLSGCGDGAKQDGGTAAVEEDQQKRANEMLHGYSDKYNKEFREKKAQAKKK